MPPIEMIALKPLTYAGKRRKTGEEFPVRGQSDARVLIAIGSADFAPADEEDLPPAPPETVRVAAPAPAPIEQPAAAETPKPGPEPETRTEAAEPPAGDATASESPAAGAAEPDAEAKPRRTYRRRDLTAES